MGTQLSSLRQDNHSTQQQQQKQQQSGVAVSSSSSSSSSSFVSSSDTTRGNNNSDHRNVQYYDNQHYSQDDDDDDDDDNDLPMKTNLKSLETPILLLDDDGDGRDDIGSNYNDNDHDSKNGSHQHSFPIPTGKEYDLIDKIASELPSVIDEESSQQVKDYMEACDNGKGPMVACFSTAEYLSLFLRKHKEAALLYENTCFRPATDKSPNGVAMDKNRSKAYPPACFNLAQMRMTGKGGTKFSRYEGYQLFDRACRAGHGGSCMMQAKMLASYPGSLGEKIPYDPKRASELLAGVCDNGDSLSCFTLATMLLRGDLVNSEADNVSPEEARGLKPIKQRKNEADRKKQQYDERISLPRDPQRAQMLLHKACDESGHAPSCYNLAVMYTQGDEGICKDEEKAKKYQEKTQELVTKFGGFGFGGGGGGGK